MSAKSSPPNAPLDTRKRKPAPRSSGGASKFFWALVKMGIVSAVGASLLLAAVVGLATGSLPSFQELVTQPRGQLIEIKASDGSTLATIGPSYGEWLPSDELPSSIKKAMVSIEDRRFYHHIGLDPIGIMRAMARNLKAGHFVQGGSTITQQVAKNVFLTSERSFARKFRELVLAMALEWKFSKDQILEIYLNRVYFGGGAYGVDAASRRFFGHSARTLSLEEASIIAGLVKAPTRYAPSSDPRKAKRRAKLVVAAMVDTGALSEDTAQQVNIGTVKFAPQPRENNVRYFTDWVLNQVESLTEETVQPLEVETTLDLRMQQDAEQALRWNVPRGLQGSLVALAHDGAIRAMVGGVDYVDSPYNRAVSARRQPGSSFKLFVYLAALEGGVKPTDTFVDEPITIDDWTPKNDNRGYIGPVTVEDAFARSINTIAVKLGSLVGFDQVAAMARRFGISTRIADNPAIALGASEVTVMDMTAAYASVARGGVEVRPYGITAIKTAGGRTLYRYQPEAPRELVSPDVAAQMTKLLEAAVNNGTGRAANIGRPAAGKTGTTQSNRDGWFLGFTADLTAGVWMGRDDNRPVPGLAGGRTPAKTWAAFMRTALHGTPLQPLFADAGDVDANDPDQDAYGLTPTDEAAALQNNGDGEVPEASEGSPPNPAQGEQKPRLDDAWLDKVLNEPKGGSSAPRTMQ